MIEVPKVLEGSQLINAANVLSRLQRRSPACGLPGDFYRDAGIYDLELNLIFYKEWLFAAHTVELGQTGSYLTLQVGAYPILLTRDRDGRIQAFVNSCRHRGARVCQDSHGVAPKLVCPYHQWTYELDGRLFAARQMGSTFDRSQFALKRIHCEIVAGYIFICVAPQPPDFTATRRQIEPYLLPHQLTEARVAFESTIVEEGNWKLIWENNRECYHCARNHPELSMTYPDRPTITSTAADQTVLAHWKGCEALGLPSEFQLSADGQVRTTRLPLIGSAVSYTMSGRPAVRKPLSNAIAPQMNIGALLLFHYPSSWNHFLGDHAISFRVLPLGPTRTQLTTKWLVNRDAVEGVDYDVEELTRVWLATNEQDRHIVQENQIGMNTPVYEPGPYSEVMENGVRQFVDWYSTRMQERLVGENLTDVA
jgi:Rieske 2Fe-2S family protein